MLCQNNTEKRCFVLLNCDQAAAVRIDEDVLAFHTEACRIAGTNQEALHQEAREVRKALEAAGQELVRDLTGRDDFTVCFADSGTGVFHLLSAAGIVKEKRILTSHLEHPALSAMLKRESGVLTFAPCDRYGKLIPAEGEFDFAAFTAVQSELGTIQDIPGLFSGLPEKCIRFVDAVQMAGKLPMEELALSADLIAVSGFKFGCPGGAALLVRTHTSWSKKFLEAVKKARHPEYTLPRVFPPAALSCASALHKRKELLAASLENMRVLNALLRQALACEQICFSVPESESSPYILHCRLPGKQGAVVVRQLSEKGIMAGAGSACNAESDSGSPVLRALGFSKKESFSGLRLSFGFDFTRQEAEFLAENLLSVLKNY